MQMVSLAEQIRRAHALDQTNAKPAVSLRDLPVSYEAITNEWLTAVVCGEVAGAAVTSHCLGPPDDGTNNRRRIFLRYNEAGRCAKLPASVFCKATHNLRNRLILGHSGAVIGEVTFYREARRKINIEAPRALFAGYDPVSFNSIVVLDDLGDAATFCSHETQLTRADAENQVLLLSELHGRFYDAPELERGLAVLPTWRERFANLQRFNLEQCAKQGFADADSVVPERLAGRGDEVWPATVEAVGRHDVMPRTLCHGDVHLKNWYRTASAAMGLADWGVAHRGDGVRDLAYAIATSLDVEQRRAWERELIQLYLDGILARGVRGVGFDDLWTRYRQALFSVLAFWTMTLAPSADMPDMQPRETSLCFIGRITHAIDDLNALDSF